MSDVNDFNAWRNYFHALGLTTIPTFGIVNGQCRCKDGPECGSSGKHPRGGYKRGYGPGNFVDGDNVAVLTDPLVVIDIDYDGLDEVSKELDLPETFTVKTNNGYHMWYMADPETPCKSVAGVLPKVDVRAIGGIVITPPSRTKAGGRYTHVYGGSPIQVPNDLLARLPKKSDDAERLLIVKGESPDETPQESHQIVEEQMLLVLGAKSGERNQALFRASCRIAEYNVFGYVGDDAFVALRIAAEQIGLTKTEAENTINSARYEINKS